MENKSSKFKYPWSPWAILTIGVLFSFLPAGIMNAINWERFGQPEKKKKRIIITVAAFVIFVIISILIQNTNEVPKSFVLALNGAIVGMLFFEQKEIFAKYIKEGGKRGSIKAPLVWSFLMCIAYVGLFLTINYSELKKIRSIEVDSEEYSEAVEFARAAKDVGEGKYAEAEAVFLKYKAKYPGDANTCYNLARIYALTNRLDMAKKELETTLKLSPDDKEAEEFLKGVNLEIEKGR